MTSGRPREDLATAIEKLTAESGYEKVHVIGHSLGGLITRYYVQRMGGHERVHTVVTLGTPHQGTALARAGSVLPLIRQLRPDSDLIAELGRTGTRLRHPFHRLPQRPRPADPAPAGTRGSSTPICGSATSRSAASATCR